MLKISVEEKSFCGLTHLCLLFVSSLLAIRPSCPLFRGKQNFIFNSINTPIFYNSCIQTIQIIQNAPLHFFYASQQHVSLSSIFQIFQPIIHINPFRTYSSNNFTLVSYLITYIPFLSFCFSADLNREYTLSIYLKYL